MKHLLHVFHYGKQKFDFRLSIIGMRFRSLETWHSPRDAGFWADCLKLYLREKFHVLGARTAPTLDPAVFTAHAESIGVHLADLSQLRDALPPSSRDFLLYSNDQLVEFAETQTKTVRDAAALKEFKKRETLRKRKEAALAFIAKTQEDIRNGVL